ncbi:hypothetical protein Tco_1122583 [Tanacetum coccineum]|uniref:Uncharacterized protein n=1 Tax=Tanacetum coccineum TaxID=301880 RepID=A0ABQ5J3X3_9ASTR
MLRHRSQFHPLSVGSCLLREYYSEGPRLAFTKSYECLASAPLACTARQMVFSSPWLTPKKESGSPLQTALVCFSNPLIVLRVAKNPMCVHSHLLVTKEWTSPGGYGSCKDLRDKFR